MMKLEAEDFLRQPSPMIRHLLDNGDNTYSIMAHINCEWCDFCEAGKNLSREELITTAFPAKENAYENQSR